MFTCVTNQMFFPEQWDQMYAAIQVKKIFWPTSWNWPESGIIVWCSISLSACIAISRKLVQECIRKRFQAFAPVVHINGRHYLNVTTQNAQQKEHLKSQFLKEQSLVSILLLQLSLCLISSALVSATDLCCCKMNDLLEIYDLRTTTYICMAKKIHKLEITYQISHVSWLACTPNVSIYKLVMVLRCCL